jgi:hypothetical protein
LNVVETDRRAHGLVDSEVGVFGVKGGATEVGCLWSVGYDSFGQKLPQCSCKSDQPIFSSACSRVKRCSVLIINIDSV